MPHLLDSLLNHDLGHLRIIAELWGIELASNETDAAREELSASLLDFELTGEILETLGPSLRAALDALSAQDGRMPWAEFTRQCGDIRAMGAGKRDRERPHLKPASTAEALFYRGFVARAFFETHGGAQEFAYIPADLLAVILSHRDTESQSEDKKESPSRRGCVAKETLGRPASPGEKGKEIPATDFILDDAATLLAALRMGKPLESGNWLPLLQKSRLLALLAAANLIEKNVPQAEAIRNFLEMPRGEALKLLTAAWMESDTFNELRQVPNLVCEGEWTNKPQETRAFLLNLLAAVPEGKWWSLKAFIRDVKQKYADFQRPAAGDYDSWFIKRASDGQYLRGFAYWDEVDGALIRYFITDILHWLGQVDLSVAEGSAQPTAFRLTEHTPRSTEDGKLHISSNGKIAAPRLTPRAVRYQLARFCEWDEEKPDEYRYHVTSNSLTRAKEQGLKVEHLLALLAKHSEAGMPPVFVKALKRWEANGTEARVETHTVLRVGRPEVLQEIRRSKAAKYLGEALGPAAVVVKSGAIQKVMEALTELGLLTDADPSLLRRNDI